MSVVFIIVDRRRERELVWKIMYLLLLTWVLTAIYSFCVDAHLKLVKVRLMLCFGKRYNCYFLQLLFFFTRPMTEKLISPVEMYQCSAVFLIRAAEFTQKGILG